MRGLKKFLLITDLGFIFYWLITILHIIPEEFLFNDYNNSILVSWNWSFLPLDLLISATGLTSIYLYDKNIESWKSVVLISLVLTFCSGLQAIAFWIIRFDFQLTWWIPNLFLMLYPLFYINQIRLNKIN
ncbi:MAG: DUF5360 family protein [Clostridiaceae bacterium]